VKTTLFYLTITILVAGLVIGFTMKSLPYAQWGSSIHHQ
jgi:hypothetical protein